MGFAGIQKDFERADVIAYLRTLSDKPASAADGREVSWRNVGHLSFRTARHCLAVLVSGDRGLFTGAFRRSRCRLNGLAR